MASATAMKKMGSSSTHVHSVSDVDAQFFARRHFLLGSLAYSNNYNYKYTPLSSNFNNPSSIIIHHYSTQQYRANMAEEISEFDTPKLRSDFLHLLRTRRTAQGQFYNQCNFMLLQQFTE